MSNPLNNPLNEPPFNSDQTGERTDVFQNPTQNPTWEDAIQFLFSAPYWIPEGQRGEIAQDWKGCMSGYGVQLNDYYNVRQWAVTIYQYLYSQAMPLTTNDSHLWPDAAVEQLRLWINEGCRHTSADPIEAKEIIPPPNPRPVKLRRRKNILDLTLSELNEYRMKLEEFGSGDASPDSPWQKMGYIHTNWCLHYQEAFVFWHRANLLYFETLIDFPIPYWDFMSPDAARDGEPAAGLPQPFKELTYTHPRTGELRPNPLRFSVAKDGRSKACVGQGESQGKRADDIDCLYVQRDPVLYTQGDDQRVERQRKLDMIPGYQQQILHALQWPRFSTPEGWPGYPWANIQTFPAPDSSYPHKCDFDGLYEQPHDNFHGWLGLDMADNAYTAFDAVFWSYHANIDRIFEAWNRAHPDSTFTSNFPLRPFVGSQAAALDYLDRRRFIFTTIGDMAKDSRSLGYDYLPLYSIPNPPLVLTAAGAPQAELYIAFNNVRCVFDTYTIDVFLNLSNPQPSDIHDQREHYVGRQTRLGMGIEDDKGRCVKTGVTRVLHATDTARALGLTPDSPLSISLVVTDVTTGKQLTSQEYQQLPGFEPIFLWGNGISSVLQQPPTEQSSCCHLN